MTDTFDPSLLSGYLDNELTSAETAVVKQALAQNAELRQELEDIRKLRAAIAALPLPPVQSDLLDGIRQRIEQQRVERLSPMVHGAPATLKMLLSFAVAACVLLAVGWTILQNRPTSKTVALEPNSEQIQEQNAEPSRDLTLDRSQADSRPVAEAMAPEAAFAEAMVVSPPGDDEVSTQVVVPPSESDRAGPIESFHGARGLPPTQQRVQPQARMMLKSGRQGPAPAMSADDAPAPPSIDFAPLPLDAAPQLADAAPQAAGAAPLAAEQAPSTAPSMASPDAGPRVARAMAVPAEAAAGDSAVAVGPLQARYLKRRQLSVEPLANTARTANPAATPADAQPQLIVSTLRKDQLEAALQWWRDRVPVVPAAGPQAKLDPATQVLAVAGDGAAVAKLSADWDRYMEQIHGQTRRQPLAVPALAGANGMLAIEFRIME